MLCWLAVDATIMGIIISVMEDEFPDWWRLVLCALAASLGTNLAAYGAIAVIGPYGVFVGMLAGAIAGGCAISALCGMTVQRACIAAGIFLGIRFAIAVTFILLAVAVTK